MSMNSRHIRSKIFNTDPLVISLLEKRGIRSVENISNFLYPTFSQLHNPFLLNGMKKTIKRLVQAFRNKEKIVIYGDYDADGITATSILKKVFSDFHANYDFQIPFRSDGYGITSKAVEHIYHLWHPSLIITVDNGSNAHEAIKRAKELKIDVIVTDHHDILSDHPDAFSFINPKRSDSHYPFRDLSGSGVALKIAQALYMIAKANWKNRIWNLIDLAAIGTIADVMPLVNENRIICHAGLQKLNANESPFAKIFFQELKLSSVSSSTIGFKIAPLLNASGRIGDPNLAVIFLSSLEEEILIFKKLFDWNERRKELTKMQFINVEKIISDQHLDKDAILVIDGDFHEGIIGILAAKTSEKYNKPSIVISHERGKGSARNIESNPASITNVISSSAHLLRNYGGHHGAAGLSIDNEKISQFRTDINRTQCIKEHDPISSQNHLKKKFDFIVPIYSFSKETYRDFHLLEPFGDQNEKPIFFSPNTFISNFEFFGKEKNHLKFFVGEFQAIQFFNLNKLKEGFYDVFYTIEDNYQLLVLNISPSTACSISS